MSSRFCLAAYVERLFLIINFRVRQNAYYLRPFLSHAGFTMSRGDWSRMPGHFRLWLFFIAADASIQQLLFSSMRILLFCLQRIFFVCSGSLFSLQRSFFVCSASLLFAVMVFCLQRIFFVCSVSLVGQRTIRTWSSTKKTCIFFN